MPIKLFKALRRHDHWYAEWWSAVFMVTVGLYAFLAPNSEIIHQSFIEGFLSFFSANIVKALFITFGFFQLCMLRSESLMGRAVAAFFASTLLSWGFLNVLLYGQFHFNLIALGVFASINLYALSRIVRGIEKHYVHYS